MQITSFHELSLLSHDLSLLIPSITVLLLYLLFPLAMRLPLILVSSLRLVIPFPLAVLEFLDISLRLVPPDVQLQVDAFLVDLSLQLLNFL